MISVASLNPWWVGLLVNGGLILLLHRLPVLTAPGWVHGGALGTMLWGTMGWRGWLTVVLYLALGSAVTRLGLRRKQALQLAEARGGRRGPRNLWGSAATGLSLAVLMAMAPGARPLLILGFVASFAAKLGDTWGSEIGKRWGARTLLITTLQPVPPGTEGAISITGTVASLVAVVMYAALALTLLRPSLGPGPLAQLVLLGTAAATATIVESWIGATWQGRVAWLTNELVNAALTIVAALLAMGAAVGMGWH
ncbi:MAG: membrane protein [Candidatus Synechococcus spongiarum 142]|uniref:Membrane protein n=1 Tax=Candidatus Synechococcus spongiarum 142 TaxID=1608213 RepID=A0A6N3X8Y5_9SYNE|nr:MAG: membrane protein [Candidatus Synechococcus spongiarum 142]